MSQENQSQTTEFDALFAELDAMQADGEALTKSFNDQAGNDEQEEAANEGDGTAQEEGAEGDKSGEGESKDGGEAVGTETSLVKSFTLDNGDTVEAVDPEALMKSLQDQFGAVYDPKFAVLGDALQKCMGVMRSQSDLLKAQGARIDQLAKSGAGRKSAVTMTTTPAQTAAAEQPVQMNRQEFMVKSEAAWKAGRINGREANIIETSLNQGVPLDAALIQKVMGS